MTFTHIFVEMIFVQPQNDTILLNCDKTILLMHYLILKGAHGICFAMKLSKELLHLFTNSITLCKYVTFPLITKFKTNRSLNYLSVN